MLDFWAHQIEGDAKAGDLPGFAYHMEMGTGKTGAAILTIRRIMNTDRRHKRTLIFTPPMVVPQWKEEFKRFSNVEQSQITLLIGKGDKRYKTFMGKAYRPDNTPAPHIFVTNYESLLLGGKRGEKKGSPYQPGPLLRAFQAWKPEVVVWDEAHYLKSPEAQRSKEAFHLSNPFDLASKQWAPKPRTLNLTGTPILNSALDIFQQFKVMLGGFPTRQYMESMGNRKYLIDNFFVFRARYFRDRNAGMPKERYFPKWEPMTLEKDGLNALAEIEEIIAHFSFRKTKAECLDLPPELVVPLGVGMTEEQAEHYKHLKEQLITYMGDRACTAKLAITKALRLLQVTSGFLSLDGQGEETDVANVRFQGTPKVEALRHLLEHITPTAKVLVWTVWKETYGIIRDVCEDLKIEMVEANGDVSDSKKRLNVERFKTDEKVRVFSGHPRSGGVGLNLVVAPYSITFSRTFSLADFLQARARNHRGGAEIHDKITQYELFCNGTLEEGVIEKLSLKQEIGATLLGDLKKMLAMQSATP